MQPGLSIEENTSLKPFNTFGIDVAARYLAAIRQPSDLTSLLSQKTFHDMPKLILGDGGNILFTKRLCWIDYPVLH